MSRFQAFWLVALAGLVIATIFLAIADEHKPTAATFRETVLRADAPRYAGRAYEFYFLRIGRAGLKDLLNDENTGIALQAAWETHLKPVRQFNSLQQGNDENVEPAELGEFVDFFKQRTKVPVPDWWAATVTKWPEWPHPFDEPIVTGPEAPMNAMFTRKNLRVEMKGDMLVCKAGDGSIEFPKNTFRDPLANSFVGSLGKQRSVVAAYQTSGAFPSELAGFTGKGGTPAWRADVWGCGRGYYGSLSYHFVEMTERNGIVSLFGVEPFGAYAEAFDAVSGTVQFRFCTSYWGNSSEAWGLK